eukprot:1748073-Ditylum_brightwellii.AAC.2
MRGQSIGMNSCVTMGKYLLDVGMLSILPEELYSITVWASDTLVLMIVSYKSVRQILDASFQDEETKTVLVTTLLFLCMHLAAIKMKNVIDYCTHVQMMWSSLVFMLHLNGVSIITKCNWIMGIVASIFNVMMKTAVDPHRDPTKGYNLGKGVDDYMPEWNTNEGPFHILTKQFRQNITNSPVNLLNDFLTYMHQEQKQHFTGIAVPAQNDDVVVDINNDGNDDDGTDNNKGDKYQGGAIDNRGNILVTTADLDSENAHDSNQLTGEVVKQVHIDGVLTKLFAASSLEEVMNKKLVEILSIEKKNKCCCGFSECAT